MIIEVRSPTRISLFGGGCDYPIYYEENPSLVINFAINIYQRITLYTEQDVFSIPQNQFALQDNPEFFYNIFEYFNINSGKFIRVKHEFDGITESGLGSSGSLAVALVSGLMRMNTRLASRFEIAFTAHKLENQINRSGIQDHFAAAFGNSIAYFLRETITTEWLNLDEIMPSILLFHTGVVRNRNLIKSQTSEDLGMIQKIASHAHKSLTDINVVSQLLNKSYEIKKTTSSNKQIDEIYAYAMKNGALAGKLLGSGGGGYMIFIVPLNQKEFIRKMTQKGLTHWDFSLDQMGVTTRILP